MMKRRICITLNLLLLTLVSATSTLGCSGNGKSEYRMFTADEGLASFSFEYPAFFKEPITDRSNEPSYTLVKSVGGAIEKGVESLFIFVLPVADSFPNSLAMLDYELKEQWEKFDDFRLLERTPITVSGRRGELITFSYSGLALEGLDVDLGGTGISHIAYFDSKGFIWKVQLVADESVVKRAKAHFEHVLETFKILD